MERFLCIHGHFYQPPRENPWLESIEIQDSAAPCHDWNERVSAECYAPNATARILDVRGRIASIVNNYSRISFNFGPTLLGWLARHDPESYQAVREADRIGAERFSGHGPAIAQAHGHLIMPLANLRDKVTQTRWGILDFRHHFGRDPEGMWLPETAVDTETLEVLAQEGIRYTILAPHQARRIRPAGSNQWHELPRGGIDTRRAYLCPLPSGRSIVLFFYNGSVAQQVAFSDTLDDGVRFADRLLGGISAGEGGLAHIATDGETYGHHHRFGEMALAYCLQHVERHQMARLTVYGEFLKLYPPEAEVEIVENSSWSCAHGVERWRSDCGCHTGGQGGWTQTWRTPLRQALDRLRDRLSLFYEEKMRKLVADPWELRDRYAPLLLDRSPERIAGFFDPFGIREENRSEALLLLEMQRHAMQMYTSCGWFFNDVSGIETVQILAYAGRAMQLASSLGAPEMETEFLGMLGEARSNRADRGSAADIYRREVRPRQADLTRVAAHYVIAAAAAAEPETTGETRGIGCFAAHPLGEDRRSAAGNLLAVGRAAVSSKITLEREEFSYAVLRLGGLSLSAGVAPSLGEEDFAPLRADLLAAFERGDLTAVVRMLDTRFGTQPFDLRRLFLDEQRRILAEATGETYRKLEALYREVYDENFTLMRFLSEVKAPLPPHLAFPAQFILNNRVRGALESDPPDAARLHRLLREFASVGVPLDTPALERVIDARAAALLKEASVYLQERPPLQRAIDFLILVRALPVAPRLWKAQNLYHAMGRLDATLPAAGRDPERGKLFERLGTLLNFAPPS